jgi:tetratricopeptide (TPR) repeat protein
MLEAADADATAAGLKEQGNESYRIGRYEEALDFFSKAIQLDPKNETLYCNRSMCHAALLDWNDSAIDAKESIALSEKYVKAHYRLVKAQLELDRYKDARVNLLHAIRLCGECKELKTLEGEILLKTKIPLRPCSTDFEVIDELGNPDHNPNHNPDHPNPILNPKLNPDLDPNPYPNPNLNSNFDPNPNPNPRGRKFQQNF